MVFGSVFYSILVLASVSVQPASVPARGSQTVTIEVEKPGMYHLSVRSEQGTTCEVVDSHRGPFAMGGELGRRDCELDLLLDSGSYLVRLRSAEKAVGTVSVTVKEFVQDRPKPVLLKRGRSDNVNLRPGHQVSWWLRIEKRRDVEILVAGRSAGRVVLWRDGEWSQSIGVLQEQYFAKPGQPRYSWRLSGYLEPADYRLVVYGTKPKKWTQGSVDESVFVSNGYESVEKSRLREFVLPPWGLLAIKVPPKRIVAHLQLRKSADGPASLTIRDAVYEPGDRTTMDSGSCSIAPKSLVPECFAFSNSSGSHVLVLKGPPGTRGTLRWSEYLNQPYGEPVLADDLFAPPASAIQFNPAETGKYLLSVVDMPYDPDAVPLACELLPMTRSIFGSAKHMDYVKLGRGRYLDRRFNYNGRNASIWFRVDDSGLYSISTSGKLAKTCELFSKYRSLSKKASGCNLTLPLAAGLYRFELYRGKPGVESISIKPGPWAGKTLAPVQKTSCWFKGVKLLRKTRYRLSMNRQGRVAARGLVLRRLPLKLDKPLFVLVDPYSVHSLPIAAGVSVRVRASGSAGLLCSRGAMPPVLPSSGQEYELPVSKNESILNIGNAEARPMWVSVSKQTPKSTIEPLAVHSPKLSNLLSLETGKTLYLDFDRGQSRSVVLRVPKAGVYEAKTVGLLATTCALSTPVFAEMFSDRSSGRGRNCLLAGYLSRGNYLFSATVTGQSKGRAGLTIGTRKIKTAPPVADGDEVFFKVPADKMVKQTLIVKTEHRYHLSTNAQGANLQCRLEDSKAWPMLPVPTSCDQDLILSPGTYYWIQMPLAVESSRATSLVQVKNPEDEILSGQAEYKLMLNKRYTVQLNKSGRDRFRFSVQASMNVTIALDRGMEAKLSRLSSKDKWHKDIGADDRAVELLAGKYELVARHCMDDVGVRYHLQLLTDVLAPGVSKTGVQVPGSFRLKVGTNSVVRIGTKGTKDVRCSLFDSAGQLKAQSDHVGDDWNCLAATMMPAGEYNLVVETADGSQGVTDISVSSPQVRSIGQIRDGAKLAVGHKVLVATLPATKKDVVQEVGFSSMLRFSCRLEDDDGRGLEQYLDVLGCSFLVRSLGKQHRVRLWTRRWSGTVMVRRVDRRVEVFSKGRLSEEKAARVKLATAGRYETGDRLWCADAGQRGPLHLCSGEASLEKGEIIFSSTGAKSRPNLSMKEMVFSYTSPLKTSCLISKTPVWQRQHSNFDKTIHLLSVLSTQGSSINPLCSLNKVDSERGGAFRLAPGACFAASSPAKDVLARWRLSESGKPDTAKVEIQRIMARVPDLARTLTMGKHELFWSGQVARYSLPKAPTGISVVLPLASWAVLVNPAGTVDDICPPADGLNQCKLWSNGGELLLVSNSQRRAVVQLLGSVPGDGVEKLDGAIELWPDARKRIVLKITSGKQPRSLEVHGAKSCWLTLEDGSRSKKCMAEVPSDTGGRLELDLLGGPVSVVLAERKQLNHVRWGTIVPIEAKAALPMAQRVALTGKGGVWNLDLPGSSLVSLKADSGLCALVGPSGGFEILGDGAGCVVHRLLAKGTWKMMVRPFANKALHGAVCWDSNKPGQMKEGMGRQKYLAPGGADLFRFELKNKEDIGIGVKADRDVLNCSVLTRAGDVKANACLTLLHNLPSGEYFLLIELGQDEKPVRFRPVVLGLHGSGVDIPDEFLREFFKRTGGER